MTKKLDIKKIIVPLISTLFIFGLFFYMTYKTPLAGDDWGYAINGLKGNPIRTAIEFYNTWSGRFFSELWGFIVAPNKWLWNILNPLLFASIFLYIFLITNKAQKNGLYTSLLIICMILNVNSDLRMETYTWIMGDTYVIPLALSLLYFMITLKYIDDISLMPLSLKIINGIACFYIGLKMENIAAIMVFAQIILLIYYYIKNKKLSLEFIIYLVLSLISFIIMRVSPGSNARLMRDHVEFNSLPLLDKFLFNMPNFIGFSFVEHKFTILFFATSLIGISFYKEKNKLLKYLFIAYQLISIFLLFSLNVGSVLHNELIMNLNDKNNPIIWLYWFVYIVMAFVIIIRNVKNEKDKLKVLFFIVLAGSSNLVMLVSPIFGARSSLYFVYYIIIATALNYQLFIEDAGKLMILMLVVFISLIGLRTREYLIKYNKVSLIENERQQIINYYRGHQNELDIYIPRMPIYTIHGADIEEDDVYHFETFKAYYGLNPDANVTFYWKESY